MRSSRKFPSAFSLLELLVAVVVLCVIGTVAVAGYQGYIEQAADMRDQTNQAILEAACRIQMVETGTTCGSISELTPDNLERAFAFVTAGKRPYTLWAHAMEAWEGVWGDSVAEASLQKYYKGSLADWKLVNTCPVDSNPPKILNGQLSHSSYMINPAVRGKSFSQFQQLTKADPDLPIVMEATAGGENRFDHVKGIFSRERDCMVVLTASGPAKLHKDGKVTRKSGKKG